MSVEEEFHCLSHAVHGLLPDHGRAFHVPFHVLSPAQMGTCDLCRHMQKVAGSCDSLWGDPYRPGMEQVQKPAEEAEQDQD